MTKTLQDDLFNYLGENRHKLDKKFIYDVLHYYTKYIDIDGNKNDLNSLHSINVANILSELRLDDNTIAAGLLNRLIQKNPCVLTELKNILTEEAFFLLQNLQKIHALEERGFELRDAQNFCKLLLATAEDAKVLLIKLACHLNTMKSISSWDKNLHVRLASETMEIYAPLAERMGINSINMELQDLAFNVLYPEVRNSILNTLEISAYNNDAILDEIQSEISLVLKKSKISAQVYIRKKTPYSIWKKMQQKNVSIDQLSDILACRIIVNNIQDCYRALSIIHSIYDFLPEMFKDFISFPKNNGYQSLHTIVLSKKNKKLEVQIRTEYMHNIAEFGVAAHWSYKRWKTSDWISNTLDMTPLHQYINPKNEVVANIENTKLELYKDRVFCFTPKNQLLVLQKNASVLDFSFALHSDLGLRFNSAEINGNEVDIKAKLSNGDKVEIFFAKEPKVLACWMEYVVTAKAKYEIRNFLKNQQKLQYRTLGGSILQKLAHSLNIQDFYQLCLFLTKRLNKMYIDDLLLGIGNKQILISTIATIINHEYNASSTLALPNKQKFLTKMPPSYSKSPEVVIKESIQAILINNDNAIELFFDNLDEINIKLLDIKFKSQAPNFLEIIAGIRPNNEKSVEDILKHFQEKNNIISIKRYSK